MVSFRNRKVLILGVIINLLGVWSFYYMFYGKENSFDHKKKVTINSSKIIKIETDHGTWKWNDSVFDFYNDYKVVLKDKNDIKSFCRIMETSKAKYIDTRTSDWIDIYINEIDLEPEIKLQKTMANEIYFEYDDHTYEGTELAKFIKGKIVKVK